MTSKGHIWMKYKKIFRFFSIIFKFRQFPIVSYIKIQEIPTVSMLKTDFKNVGHHVFSVINYSCDKCTNKNSLTTSLIYHVCSLHEKSMIFQFTCDICANKNCHMTQLMNHVVCVHEDKSYAQLENVKVEQKNQ